MSLSALYEGFSCNTIPSVHVRVQCSLVPRPRMSEKSDFHGLGKRLIRGHGMETNCINRTFNRTNCINKRGCNSAAIAVTC